MVPCRGNDVKSRWKRITDAQKAISLAAGRTVKGFSRQDCTRFVKGRTGLSTSNPLIQAVHLAFNRYLPLMLTPDMVWITILQGVSEHIKKNPEKYRLSNLPSETAILALRTCFTTTDETADAAVSMDIISRVQYPCGIPCIKLAGTKEDWQALRAGLALLDDLELTEWRGRLESILVEFEEAFDNRVKPRFWHGIFLKHGGSDEVTTYTGWIAALFLYTMKGLNPIAISERGEPLNPTSFRAGLSTTPFTWDYLGNTIELVLREGFVGVVVDTESNVVEPQLGWLVSELEPRSGI